MNAPYAPVMCLATRTSSGRWGRQLKGHAICCLCAASLRLLYGQRIEDSTCLICVCSWEDLPGVGCISP